MPSQYYSGFCFIIFHIFVFFIYISKSPYPYPGKRYFCKGWSLTYQKFATLTFLVMWSVQTELSPENVIFVLGIAACTYYLRAQDA